MNPSKEPLYPERWVYWVIGLMLLGFVGAMLVTTSDSGVLYDLGAIAFYLFFLVLAGIVIMGVYWSIVDRRKKRISVEDEETEDELPPLMCSYCGDSLSGLEKECPHCGHTLSGEISTVYQCSRCGAWVKHVDNRWMCDDCRHQFLGAVYSSPSSPHNIRKRIRL